MTVPASGDDVKPMHVHSPLVPSPALSALAGAPVLLKLDNVQPSGSFKIRGHGRLISLAASRGVSHVVSSSGGNAGAAVAFAGAQLGLRVTIVVPTTTPPFMVRRLRSLGAEVETHGAVWDEADKRARAIVAKNNGAALHVSPFDHPHLWDGIASLPKEIVHDLGGRRPSVVALSVGGGGLFCGVAKGLAEVGWEDVPIVAAETDGAASFAAMAREGKAVSIGKVTSIAKSLGACTVAEKCVAWVNEGRPVQSVVVSDREAVEACSMLAVHHRLLVEPACGAAIAAVCRKGGVNRVGDGPIVIVVCGGNMVSPELLESWIESTGAKKAELDT